MGTSMVLANISYKAASSCKLLQH